MILDVKLCKRSSVDLDRCVVIKSERDMECKPLCFSHMVKFESESKSIISWTNKNVSKVRYIRSQHAAENNKKQMLKIRYHNSSRVRAQVLNIHYFSPLPPDIVEFLSLIHI